MLLSLERLQEATISAYLDVAAIMGEAFAQRELLGLAKWAETYYRLPPDSAVQGLFRFARSPYLREPAQMLQDPRVKQVVVAKGSQLFFTTLAQIWKGWTMDEDPASMICVWPSEGLLKRYVITRINPMLEDVIPLRKIFTRSGLRDSDDSFKYKGFPGGGISFVTGRSSSQLKSMTAQRMHVSELDELEPDVKGQGDPLDQARRALRTHPRGKEYLECTPTIAGRSRVWQELKLSSWRELHLMCPGENCNYPQVLRWREGQEDGDNEGAGRFNFVYELDTAGRIVPESTRYVCVKCGMKIEHKWKRAMVTEGNWVPRYPDRIAFQGYHLSALYSLAEGYDWDVCAQMCVNGLTDPAKQKVAINTILALPYEEKEASGNPRGMQARAHEYGVEIPFGVVLITISVDVQIDRVEYQVMGFGAGLEWWLIEWGRLEGDPGKGRPGRAPVWTELEDVLNRDWVDADGVCYDPKAIAIDAGYLQEHVRAFCARFTTKDGVRPIHTMGRAGRARPLLEKPKAETTRRRRRARKPSYIIGTDTMNDLLYARFRIEQPGPGYLHTPTDRDIDQAWYDQIYNESLQEVVERGLRVKKWLPVNEDAPNEAIDLTRGCYAALVSLGQKVMLQLETMRPPSPTAAVKPRGVVSSTEPLPEATIEPEEVPVAPKRAARIARRRPRGPSGMISEAVE
ncbi:phage terminase GpA family protein [Gemmatimonas aurantiaca T-27]|uniref:Phage terminase GpA family protein n=2 Tax=Gemmatimonas aurantiaca TaxID=173480 RepID=C1A9W4_GEMAT|nr:terminase gpA endonuclease subunit [Gemmatimonas aurantiaca]BAH39291.1 phage terminase GpA family protein [Gemmatimonas aurantiaca T-27]